jgi:hypothetical protein
MPKPLLLGASPIKCYAGNRMDMVLLIKKLKQVWKRWAAGDHH